jgi:hypothetical protein
MALQGPPTPHARLMRHRPRSLAALWPTGRFGYWWLQLLECRQGGGGGGHGSAGGSSATRTRSAKLSAWRSATSA